MPSIEQNVSARRRFPENSLSRDLQLPLPVPQTHRCMFLSHQYRNLAGQLSPAKREHSIHKRQTPAAVSTVLTTAGVYSGNEMSDSHVQALLAAHNGSDEERKANSFGVIGMLSSDAFTGLFHENQKYIVWCSKKKLSNS